MRITTPRHEIVEMLHAAVDRWIEERVAEIRALDLEQIPTICLEASVEVRRQSMIDEAIVLVDRFLAEPDAPTYTAQ